MRGEKPAVLLLNPPAPGLPLRDYYCCTHSKTGYLWPPVDLIVQSGILGREFDVKVIDAPASRDDSGSVIDKARAWGVDAVLSLTGSMSLDSDMNLLREIASATGATVIVSGDVVLGDPAALLEEYPFVNAALLCFLTNDIIHLLRGETHLISCMAFRKDGRVELIRNKPPTDFDYPFPAHHLFSSKSYRIPFSPAGFSSVLTSYGCPYSCSFCNSGLNSLGFAQRNIDGLKNELAGLYSGGARHVFIKDMTFGVNARRREEICRFLREETPRMTWNAYTRADLLDEAVIEMYADSGCRLLQMGVESAAGGAVEDAGTKADAAHLRRVLQSLRSAGVASGLHYILGLPGETPAQSAATIRLASSLHSDYASFNIFRPRAGSHLARSVSRADTGTSLRMLTRLAYFSFYLNPRYLAGFFTKRRSRESAGPGEFLRMIRYLIEMPDA